MKKLFVASLLSLTVLITSANAGVTRVTSDEVMNGLDKNGHISAPYPGPWTTFRMLTGDGNVNSVIDGLDENGYISAPYPGPWTTFRMLTGSKLLDFN